MIFIIILLSQINWISSACLRQKDPFISATLRNDTFFPTVEFAVSFPTGSYSKGWASIGFPKESVCNVNRGENCMKESKLIVWNSPTNRVTFHRGGSENGMPTTATAFFGLQNTIVCCLHGEKKDITFSMSAKEFDLNQQTLLWAFSTENQFGYHGNKRGAITFNLNNPHSKQLDECLEVGGSFDSTTSSSVHISPKRLSFSLLFISQFIAHLFQ